MFYPYSKCRKLLDRDPRADLALEPSPEPPSNGSSDNRMHANAQAANLAVVPNETDANNTSADSEEDDEEEDDEAVLPISTPPGFLDPRQLSPRLLSSVRVWERRMLLPLLVSFGALRTFRSTESPESTGIYRVAERVQEGQHLRRDCWSWRSSQRTSGFLRAMITVVAVAGAPPTCKGHWSVSMDILV